MAWLGLDRIAAESPIGFAFLLWVIFLATLVFAGILQLLLRLPTLGQLLAADLILSGVAILLLAVLGWWKEAGFLTLGGLQHLPLYLLPLIVAFLPFLEGIEVTDPPTIATFAVLMLLVGFAEETFFRGLILRALRPAGLYLAVILSALLFGLPHLLNALSGIWDPVFTLVDSLAAVGIGITFAAFVVRTGSIWPPILLHALINFNSLLVQGSIAVPPQSLSSLVQTAAFGAIFTLYGLFLLRPGRMQVPPRVQGNDIPEHPLR